MENAALKQRLLAFCDCLSGEGRQDESHELIAAIALYNQQSPADMYRDMIDAQSTLFGGRPQAIRWGVDTIMPANSDSEKAGFLASEMRDHLVQAGQAQPGDRALNLLYKMIASFEHNVDHVWECLFLAATQHKSTMKAGPKTRSVLMVEFNEHDERDLYGSFDPFPVGHRPKFIQ